MLSFRGVDNPTYYRLVSDNPRYYMASALSKTYPPVLSKSDPGIVT